MAPELADKVERAIEMLGYRPNHTAGTLRRANGYSHSIGLIFDDVAPQVKKYPNYFHVWHGTMWGFAKMAGANAHVDFTIAKDLRSAEARFTWGPKE